MTTDTTPPPTTRALLPPLLLAVALIAAACGGSDDEADAGVASLDTATAEVVADPELAIGDDETTVDGAAEPVAEVDEVAEERTDEEAMLVFAQCMRDNGVGEFPDPTTDADGNPAFDVLGSDVEIGTDDFTAAAEACSGELDGVNVGGGPGADQTEIEDTMLAFTDCLRGEGIDVGDFDFERTIAGVQSGEVDPSAGRNAVLGAVLGLDTDDPVVDEAINVCEPLLDGLGQPGSA